VRPTNIFLNYQAKAKYETLSSLWLISFLILAHKTIPICRPINHLHTQNSKLGPENNIPPEAHQHNSSRKKKKFSAGENSAHKKIFDPDRTCGPTEN
jgi:hypothetical protein